MIIEDKITYERIIAHCEPAFTDDRGVITNILDGVNIRHIAIITSAKGSRRGNHVHSDQNQWIYIISGAMQCFSVPIGGGTVNSFIAAEGDLLYCPPGVAHAYLALGDTVFLNIDDEVRNPDTYEQDTKPYIVLEEKV